jgi:DNA-binding response OmpR family regulator
MNNMENKLAILIAEDDIETAAALQRELLEQGYDVTVAHDGEVALSNVKNNQYDVVILDLKLPKVVGFVILKYIKANTPSTKVIVLTAYADLKNTEICKKLGAEHVLGKPFDLEILFWTIEACKNK